MNRGLTSRSLGRLGMTRGFVVPTAAEGSRHRTAVPLSSRPDATRRPDRSGGISNTDRGLVSRSFGDAQDSATRWPAPFTVEVGRFFVESVEVALAFVHTGRYYARPCEAYASK